MSYVKLDSDVLTSSLWVSRGQRDVFITALLMALPRYFEAPVATYEIDNNDVADFVVPPGDYGFVRAASPGLLHMAMVPEEEGMAAIRALAAPDLASRTPDFDGRRMVRINGGFLILNYDKYRQKDHTAAERMRRYRDRQAQEYQRLSDGVTRNDTQAEAEAEAEAKSKSRKGTRFALASMPESWRGYCKAKRPDLSPESVFENFSDYWKAKAGAGATKMDWDATWRQWVRNEKLGAAVGKRASAGDLGSFK